MSALTLPYPVVLASASPRRHALLRQIVPEFSIAVADLDEESHTVEDPFHTAERLALLKARHIAQSYPSSLVIGGDTVVAIPTVAGWQQLAKPTDSDDACRMLGLLSGKEHSVITGMALVWPGGEHAFWDETRVLFRSLSDMEIREYVSTGEPMDKAGAYAIQSGAAGFVESTQGAISTVVGLPVEALTVELEKLFGSR